MLNLGCGQFKKEGFLNVDWDAKCSPDMQVNLEELPYPFPDSHFKLIETDHLLEHLGKVFDIMRELHRISAPGGRCVIRVPHFSRAMTHAEHKHGFDFTFPFYFDPTWKGGYTGAHFELQSMRLTWFAQPELKRTVLSTPSFFLGNAFGMVADLFANLSPVICSRFWCFLVGGFEEIEYHFVCRK